MDISSRPSKTQTQAGSRPSNRNQKRGQSRGQSRGGVQKRNPTGISEGLAYLGSGTTATTGKSMYKNVPLSGQASDIFNPSKKDGGFFVHKRGGGDVQRTKSNEQKDIIVGNKSNRRLQQPQPKTMEQLARQGAAQAMASGQLDTEGSDQNDTTAMSDLNSLQNFSYYGRRFQDQQQRLVEESPVASDAVSLSYGQMKKPTSFGSQVNVAGKMTGMLHKGSSGLQQNTWAEANSDAGLGKVSYGRKNTVHTTSKPAGYTMEEQMNDNLMRQFEPMFSEDRTIRQRHSNQDGALLNSVSDFSQLGESVGPYSGSTQSRAQLFKQAKDKLIQQRNVMASTTPGFNQTTSTSAANQAPKKSSTAAKVLPSKLPPRAAMSPAVNSMKANNLLASVNGGIPKPQIDTPMKDGVYFAGPKGQAKQSKTPQTDIVYKRGARSISRKKTDQNIGKQQVSTANNLINKQHVDEIQLKLQNRTILAIPATADGGMRNRMGDLHQSESITSMHTAERAKRFREGGKCVKNGNMADSSVNPSLEQRMVKFNENFTSTGHCRKHKQIGCDKCSLGSSKGSHVSSLDSANALISRDILKKHRVAPRSEIGLNQAQIAKSQTRQFKKPNKNMVVRSSSGIEDNDVLNGLDNRIKSLPREQRGSSLVADPSGLIDRVNDLRRSTKDQDMKQLQGQLKGYNKRGNRPSVGLLPRPSTYTIQGGAASGSQANDKTREDNYSNDSRNLMSEIGPRRKNFKNQGGAKPQVVQSIPNFSRILSAKSSIQRQDMSKRILQNKNDHGDMLQNDVKQLANQWEGDPHDPEFWKRIEHQNDQLKEQNKNLVMGQGVRAKQEDLIGKQSAVFSQLRENDDLNSDRQSMRGTSMNFNQARASLQRQLTRNNNSGNQSKTSLFTNTIQPEQDDIIHTEIDQYDHANIVSRRMLQDPSYAVLTDCDIADEVGPQFAASVRNQMEFRDKSLDDRMHDDNNIDELKQKLGKQINDNKGGPAKMATDRTTTSHLFSNQTNKTKGTSQAEHGEITSAQQHPQSKRIQSSQVTAAFPSTEKHPQQETLDDSSSMQKQLKSSSFVEQNKDELKKDDSIGDDVENKDSEDADSFDEEKQKSQILQELDLDCFDENEEENVDEEETERDRKERERRKRRRRRRAKASERPNVSEQKLSEKSNEDEDEKRQKEIKDKTMSRVMDYDEWLEVQTQKEIERLSVVEKQSRQGQFSPKSMIKIPENGLLKLASDPRNKDSSAKKRNHNLTQYMNHTAEKFYMGGGNQIDDQQNALVETIRVQQKTQDAARPKTRGESITGCLVIDQAPIMQSTPRGELSSKKFSDRRLTSDQTYSAQKQLSASQKFKKNENEMRSPEKRFLGAAAPVPQSSNRGGASEVMRSQAQMTAVASSLKEDDLLISTSLVDPMESSRAMAAAGKNKLSDSIGKFLAPQDDLVIKEEEQSSLKSVSPLTETSRSKKSSRISVMENPPNAPEKEYQMDQPPAQPQQPTKPTGLPPKSSLLLTNKIRNSQKTQLEELPDLSESNRQSSSRQELSAEGQPECGKTVSFADDRIMHSQQPIRPQTQDSPSKKIIEPPQSSDQKVPIGQRNQAVLDFLAYEDSDDDDFGMIIKKQQIEAPQNAPEYNNEVETIRQDDEVIQLSPPKQSNLAKTPSMQFVPNDTFLQSNPSAMQALKKPLVEIQAPIAKTPTTGVVNKKRKALQLAVQKTLGVTSVPQRSTSIEEASVNEQINKIDYNQSNDGMSASFYLQHDQWMAMQGGAPNGDRTLNSHQSTRDMHNKQVQNNENYRQNGQDLKRQATQSKDVSARKTMQSRGGTPRGAQRNDSARQSSSYQRPQGYVKSALKHQDSRQSLNEAEQKPDPKQQLANKFVGKAESRGRDGSGQRVALLRQSSSIASIDSRGASTNKKEAFFDKHRDSIKDPVSSRKKQRDSSAESRTAAQNRLYKQETIASILKRNPELGYDAKKKPPAMPPRRKKKVQKPPTLQPPKEDPPEEPQPHSPRVLIIPFEPSVPFKESAPTNMPLPMRLHEEPPSEPCAFVMPNLYCPADPDTPYNFEIEPREEEYHYSPLEPMVMHKLLEPDCPGYPERMIKMSTEEFMSEQLVEESEMLPKLAEPNHDDEPALEYPTQERPLVLPPSVPSKFEPPSAMLIDEPFALADDQIAEELSPSEPDIHYLKPSDIEKTHEMSIQCGNIDEESKQAAIEAQTISDEDNFSVHSIEGVENKLTVGIQTNAAHFRKMERTAEYIRQKQERLESTDWALSPIFDEIHFAKQKKTIGGRKLMVATQAQRFENCGNQVYEAQIVQETAVQILSQIECEYNVDQLKRKMAGKDAIEDERLCQLYSFGLNTLKSLMLGLRLEKEWEVQTRHQYLLPEQSDCNDPDETVRLLIRNKKMYEAKTLIQRLLKMICERDRLVEQAQKMDMPEADASGAITANISLKKPQPLISREMVAQIKRLSTRITSQINTLQEEHRIFRRPFILKGVDYFDQIQQEGAFLDDLLAQKFFVDERGTTGLK